jgi:release factor glutamine methyltransferase
MGRRTLKPHSDTPDLDAQLLLSEVLGQTRTWILTYPDLELEGKQSQTFIRDLARCEAGEALPYVLGWWEFYGRRFQLNPEVLIPRPETELLIEEALTFLKAHPDRRMVADIGTGCGCIAVTLAAEIPDLNIIATDIERGALRIARNNAEDHHVRPRMWFIQADLLSPLKACFDLICANLPYIPSEELDDLVVTKREPRLALDGGTGGLQVVHRLMTQVPKLLALRGRALLEIGANQAEAAQIIVRKAIPFSTVDVLQDLAGRDRLLVIDKRGTEQDED